MSKTKPVPKPKLSMSLMEFHQMFPDEDSARGFFETARWPDGVVCLHCGSKNRSGWLKRWARWQCNDCFKQFTVKIGTPMERSHIDLHRWLLGMFLMMSSSKGISSWKLAEHLGLSYKAAWHMGHRIRAMMGDFGGPLKGVVEIDETYGGAPPRKKASDVKSRVGGVHNDCDAHNDNTYDTDHDDDDTPPSSGGGSGKGRGQSPSKFSVPSKVLGERKTGRGTTRPMVLVAMERGGCTMARPLATHSKGAVEQALDGVLSKDPDTVVMTDGLPAYKHLGASHSHHTVTHSARVFVCHQEGVGHPILVNTCESWNGLFKRALVGVFHQVSPWHLGRCAQESAFRWNTRTQHILDRLRVMVQSGFGKTLPFSMLAGRASNTMTAG